MIDRHLGSPPLHRAQLAYSILKALSYRNDDPHKNRTSNSLRWKLASNWIDYMMDVTPSPDFVPLIRLVNPDFVFYGGRKAAEFKGFLSWLKIIDPLPEDLIQRWEDYSFMHLSEDFQRRVKRNLLEERDQRSPGRNDAEILAPSLHTLSALGARMSSRFQGALAACREHLVQYPRLSFMLQASRLFNSDGTFPPDTHDPAQWFRLRIVLDLSWDDIQACLCSLRPLATQKSDFVYTPFLFLPALCRELTGVNSEAMVSCDLARGFIRLMRRLENREMPFRFWTMLSWDERDWGRHIRSSPQSNPELLQELNDFVPPWDIFDHGIFSTLLTLQTSSNPQPDLIDHWQNYLTESRYRSGTNYSDELLEQRWQDHLEKEAYFYGPPQQFGEEVILCWESGLAKLKKEEEGELTREMDMSNLYDV
ncbi:hypothetical protein B0H13DRAFT_2319466 [Mycena leptocephala]|nr:hypothetical protein B0H13DRAFT_2319466 [Mycena leptocephala]